jgi:hypothetical protein
VNALCGGFECREETRFLDCMWCFNCRERYIHVWTVLFDELPTYYDPHGYWACANCGRDCTVFPGVSRVEGEEAYWEAHQ